MSIDNLLYVVPEWLVNNIYFMIFVTGGTGLIGSHLLLELVSAGKEVRVLKREKSDIEQVKKLFSFYSDDPEGLFGKINWVTGDLLDYFTLEKYLEGVNEVYHCAATVSFDSGRRAEMIADNVEGTANIVNASLKNGVHRICHVSSVAALGNAGKGRTVDELTNWVPSKKVSGYSESKFFSEMEVWRGIEEGLDAVIVNPSIVLGAGKLNSGSSQFFKLVWDGLKFYTKGVTGFVDVKDVVKAMVMLMSDPDFSRYKNQRYLLNSGNLSYQELFNRIADFYGKPRPKYFATPFFLNLLCRVSVLIKPIYKKLPAITFETAAAANSTNLYDGSKIVRLMNFKYTPLTISIRHVADYYLTVKE